MVAVCVTVMDSGAALSIIGRKFNRHPWFPSVCFCTRALLYRMLLWQQLLMAVMLRSTNVFVAVNQFSNVLNVLLVALVRIFM